jgi:ABC-type cobalamin/Fe3+-siderophores transport systems, ATPase components
MISVRSLRVVYKPRGIEALREITLELPVNNVTCIIGPNASGKTTLLKAIAGILNHEGAIYIDGREVRSNIRYLRKILSYAGNMGSSVDYLGARVIDILLTSRYPVAKGFSDTKEDVEEVHRVSKILGIEHLLHRKISELSSGELQRVVIASALVKNPRVLLLDEPDTHLDVAGKSWLSKYLEVLSKTLTIVMSTHDVVFACHTCNYFVVLSSGRVLYSGWRAELVRNKEYVEKAYGMPFINVEVNNKSILIPLYESISMS